MLMQQAKIWTNGVLKDIPNLLVNKDGDLLLTEYLVKNRGGVRTVPERHLKTRRRNSRVQYLEFSAASKKYLLHRVLASTFHTKLEGSNEVRHLDDNIYNNSLENLAWGTRQENASDAKINGKAPIGAKNSRSKTVQMLNPEGIVVHTVCGKASIKELGFDQSNLHKALKKGRKYKGFTLKEVMHRVKHVEE